MRVSESKLDSGLTAKVDVPCLKQGSSSREAATLLLTLLLSDDRMLGGEEMQIIYRSCAQKRCVAIPGHDNCESYSLAGTHIHMHLLTYTASQTHTGNHTQTQPPIAVLLSPW
jgi:hypothetical protein